MKRIGVYLSYILIILGVLHFLFPTFYIAELAISFLPYMVAGHMFLAGYRLSRIFLAHRTLFVVLAVLHIVGFLYFVQFLLAFYGQDHSVVDRDDGISVLYANVSKVNYDYAALIQTIDAYDPDVLMFVEFADHHSDNLKPFLSDKYPYVNRTSWSRTFVGSMIFSRFPVDDLADDFVQGAWRYGYFRLDAPAQSYYVYLVHTSSPISVENYHMRNVQLDAVSEHVVQHDSLRDDLPVLLVGDLNVSPWSMYYDRFVSGIAGFENVTRRLPIVFSRGLEWFPLFQSHIDHVFASDAQAIGSLEQVTIPGSDHKGYYFWLQ